MVVDIQSRFGMAVRALRKQLGLSQEELAERAGLHRTYVADVERGARNLSLASIEKLARALDISIQALFSQAGGEAEHMVTEAVDILLVEDDPDDVELTLEAFRAANLSNRVHVARDGAEALEFAFCTGRYKSRMIQNRPQLILLDLKLPKVNGLEVLRQLKENKQTRSVPVVVLTASQRQQDLSESLRLGAQTYIVKPVQFNRLADVVPELKLLWALLQCVSTAPVLKLARPPRPNAAPAGPAGTI
jgi:CheY-like chemotaxis protein